MRVLFITTHPPFPPIDGEGIPEANHLLALRAEHQVDCLLLKCDTTPYNNTDVNAEKNIINVGKNLLSISKNLKKKGIFF